MNVGRWLDAPGVVVTRNQVNANQGTAQLVLTRIAPMAPVTGSGVLFSVDFDALALGIAPITLSPVQVSAPGGVPVNLSIADTSITIAAPPPSLGGQIRLGGRLEHSGVTVQVNGLGTGSTTTNTRGDYRVVGLTPGPATVTARRLGWLCTTRNVNLTAGGIQPLPAAELIPGDVNGDDDINLFDLVRVAFRYDEPASLEPATDLNGNGVVDLGDLVLVATHYGRDCPTPWTTPAAKRAPRPAVAPTLRLVNQPPAPDGTTTVEVWADELAGVAGVDFSLTGDGGLDGTAFSLGPTLKDAFVARNRVEGKTARLAVTLVRGAAALNGKVHVASLTVRGDAKALRVGRVVWAGEGGQWMVDSEPPKAAAGTISVSSKAVQEAGPAWQRPARLPRQ